MPNRIVRTFVLAGVSAALAFGGLGAASASANRSHPEDGGHHHCQGLKGKKRSHCEKHHGGQHSASHY
jgi:Spy/CpxP family protein refolding chaperone